MQLERVSGIVRLVLGDAVLLSLDVSDGHLINLTMLINVGIFQLFVKLQAKSLD